MKLLVEVSETKVEKSKPFRTKAPFGVALQRFQAIGIHPNLDTTGSTKKKSPLGPGEYNPEYFECPYKKYNIGGSPWKRKTEVEEFSKNLGFKNAEVLKDREFRKASCGPGTYDIPEECYKKQSCCALQDVGFGRQKRFWDPVKHGNPPPGTYGKPTSLVKKQFTHLPYFEWDGFVDRFRSKTPAWSKPPNLYTTKDPGSIKALLTKVVSKRGPYDLFTGPRDGSTIKNHFAPPAFKGPLTWFRTYPNELEILLNHPSKQRYGRFTVEKRFGRPTLRHMLDDPSQVVRSPDEPSPFSYDVLPERTIKESMYPFNMSTPDARPPIKWRIYPGIGRYNPKPPSCTKHKLQSWVFRSKTGRTEYKAVEYNAF